MTEVRGSTIDPGGSSAAVRSTTIRRTPAWRRFGSEVLAALVIVTGLGLVGSGDAAADASSSRSGITGKAMQAVDEDVLADLRAYISTTAPAIARDLNTFGSAQLTTVNVDYIADRVCLTNFDPLVAIFWIEYASVYTGVLTVEPAIRLLDLAARSAHCPVGPSPVQRSWYVAGIRERWSFLDGSVHELPGVLDSVEQTICGVLGSDLAGPAIASTIDYFIDVLSRGRIDLGQFVPTVIDIAGQTCPFWIESAHEALDQYT